MTTNIHAPELESPLGWLNTDKPLRLAQELKGHVVLLDFWTYCCINCIHILPDLKHLEHKYADRPFVVVGVHSAKFTNEANRQTIRAAIHRYEIEHPVIIDDQMKLWRAYAARSWPTFVIIDPEGYVAATTSGEGNRESLDNAIAAIFDEHDAKGTLADTPVTIQRDGHVQPATGLAFPGKILADRDNNRLFITDSNHNRIVAVTWPDDQGHCTLIQTIGSGQVGRDDGPPESATFDHPQGLAVSDDTLYVADTENHLIRAVDLNTWHTTTVIGTGEMGYDRAGGAMGTGQEISSPWDLAMEGGTLYIAMAGIHQIWRAEMPIGFARALAGSGRENIVDGPVETAALSQPSGICLHKGKLYFADSEVSAVRGIDLAAEQVFTLVGSGLFVFGDVDGDRKQARLQHCLGVTGWHDTLLVADTYNHKIKTVDPVTGQTATLYGTGQPATSGPDNALGLFEPGGLHASGDDLFIADTNNHRIVHVNLQTHAWTELKIAGLTPPASSSTEPTTTIDAGPTLIPTAGQLTINLDVHLPTGAHINADAPINIRITSTNHIIHQETRFTTDTPIAVTFPITCDAPTTPWRLDLTFVYCTDGTESACIPAEHAWTLTPQPSPDAPTTLTLSATT